MKTLFALKVQSSFLHSSNSFLILNNPYSIIFFMRAIQTDIWKSLRVHLSCMLNQLKTLA